MKREIVTAKAPEAIGPYSQAILIEETGLLFTAGQIALDPGTGQMSTGGVEEQTEKVLDNLTAVIEAAGGNLEGVVKTTIYLSDMGNFPKVNAVYEKYFNKPPFPARTTVEVASLPNGALVEMDTVVKLSG
jgi:2-iminobutanoate/2-iminopropanoate deaminase